jgi:hypothetical protein
MMTSFHVTVQWSSQPARYSRDYLRLVMDPMWDESLQHLVTPVRSNGLSAMKVLQVLPLHSEQQRIMCPLGVRYAIGQVSLVQMSRRSVHIPSLKEVNSCRTLVRRVHQGPRNNEDNPPPTRILLGTRTEQDYASSKSSEDANWLCSCIYFIVILAGLVIQD